MAISDKDYYAMFGVDIGANKMYESPITKIYNDITKQIIKQDEDNVMYAVNQAVEYEVDKQELIKALQYDRNQYKKGYTDAKKEYEEKLEQMRAEIEELEPTYNFEGFYSCQSEVIKIIDKSIKENN